MPSATRGHTIPLGMCRSTVERGAWMGSRGRLGSETKAGGAPVNVCSERARRKLSALNLARLSCTPEPSWTRIGRCSGIGAPSKVWSGYWLAKWLVWCCSGLLKRKVWRFTSWGNELLRPVMVAGIVAITLQRYGEGRKKRYSAEHRRLGGKSCQASLIWDSTTRGGKLVQGNTAGHELWGTAHSQNARSESGLESC